MRNFKTSESGRNVLEMIAIIVLMALLISLGLWGFKKASLSAKVNTMSKDMSTAITERRYQIAQGGTGKEHKLDTKVGATDMVVKNITSGDDRGQFTILLTDLNKDTCEEMKNFNVFNYKKVLVGTTVNAQKELTDGSADNDCTSINALEFYFDGQNNGGSGSSGFGGGDNPLKGKCDGKTCGVCQSCNPNTGTCENDNTITKGACAKCQNGSVIQNPAVSLSECETCNLTTGAIEPKETGAFCGTCGQCKSDASCDDPGKQSYTYYKLKNNVCTQVTEQFCPINSPSDQCVCTPNTACGTCGTCNATGTACNDPGQITETFYHLVNGVCTNVAVSYCPGSRPATCTPQVCTPNMSCGTCGTCNSTGTTCNDPGQITETFYHLVNGVCTNVAVSYCPGSRPATCTPQVCTPNMSCGTCGTCNSTGTACNDPGKTTETFYHLVNGVCTNAAVSYCPGNKPEECTVCTTYLYERASNNRNGQGNSTCCEGTLVSTTSNVSFYGYESGSKKRVGCCTGTAYNSNKNCCPSTKTVTDNNTKCCETNKVYNDGSQKCCSGTVDNSGTKCCPTGSSWSTTESACVATVSLDTTCNPLPQTGIPGNSWNCIRMTFPSAITTGKWQILGSNTKASLKASYTQFDPGVSGLYCWGGSKSFDLTNNTINLNSGTVSGFSKNDGCNKAGLGSYFKQDDNVMVLEYIHGSPNGHSGKADIYKSSITVKYIQ